MKSRVSKGIKMKTRRPNGSGHLAKKGVRKEKWWVDQSGEREREREGVLNILTLFSPPRHSDSCCFASGQEEMGWGLAYREWELSRAWLIRPERMLQI